jgi:hypothetical protein
VSRAAIAARLVCAGAVWLGAASPADAQLIRTKPFSGIFRTTNDPAQSRTQVDFLTFVGGGHERTTLSSEDGLLSPADDTTFGNLVFRGRVAHQGRRRTFGADAGATTSYYSGAHDLSPFLLSAAVHVEGNVGRRSTFALRQGVYYSPYFVFSPIESNPTDGTVGPIADVTDAAVDPRVDLRAARLSTKGYSTFASAGHEVGRSGSLFVSYRLNYTDPAPGAYDVLFQTPRAGYRRRMWRFARFVASYGLQVSDYRNSGFRPLVSHDLALDLTYDRPLSTWRRTAFGFSTGTSFPRSGELHAVYLKGSAHVSRRIRRTWVTAVEYRRGQQVLEGFAAPFFTFSDSATFSVSGRLFRALELSSRGSYTHGRYSISALTNAFNTVAATARAQVPIIWALTAYVEEYYTDYEFQRRLGLLQGIPRSLDRLGTRAGLTVTVPVLR